MTTYWLSIVDLHKPKGQRFVGVIVAEAVSDEDALEQVEQANLLPDTHCDIEAYPLDPDEEQPADFREWMSRTPRMELLNQDRLDEIGHERG
jgi:hypothetical protein